VEALVAHFDGYVAGTNVPFGNTDPAFVIGTEWPNTPNNCYWYHDPRTGKFVVLPHGADWSMGNAIGLVGYLNRNTDPQYLDGEMLGGARFRTLTVPKPGARTIARLTTLPGTEDRLRSNVRWVVERAWNTPKLLARADKIAQLVRSNGPPTSREEWTPESFEEAFARRRSFIEHRAAEVRNARAGSASRSPVPRCCSPRPLRTSVPMCFVAMLPPPGTIARARCSIPPSSTRSRSRSRPRSSRSSSMESTNAPSPG
jgi:hypothetical protein